MATALVPKVTGSGEVTAIVAVTGVADDVGDVLVPGCFARTLTQTRPKIARNHDWHQPIGRVTNIAELHPGDRRLPERTADGTPWPAGAGALVVTGLLNLATDAGRDAFEQLKFYGPEQSWSIGYKVTPGGATRRGGIRYIKDLNLFEVSPTLVGAHRLARTLEVKSRRPAGLEVKAARPRPAAVLDRRSLRRAHELAEVANQLDDDDESWAEVVAHARQFRMDAAGVLRPLCEVCGSNDQVAEAPGPDGQRELCRWCVAASTLTRHTAARRALSRS